MTPTPSETWMEMRDWVAFQLSTWVGRREGRCGGARGERETARDALRFSPFAEDVFLGGGRPAESSDLDGKDTRGWGKGKGGKERMRNDRQTLPFLE